MTGKNNLNDLKFEDALDRLEDIINKLQEGHISLDESLECFQDGVGLIKLCQQKLDNAETKIELLTKNSDGSTEEIPFEYESGR